jgi:hypothetical protein
MGKDMKDLVKLTEAPGARDNAERMLWDSTSQVINKCFQGYLDCYKRGWRLLPFWLSSVDRYKENTKPFPRHIIPDTFRRYIDYWQQYLLFYVRAIMIEPSVQFTSRQDDCLREVINLMEFDENEI